MEVYNVCMVRKDNKRVMITIQPNTLEKAQEICRIYDMTFTELFKMLVADFHQERISK